MRRVIAILLVLSGTARAQEADPAMTLAAEREVAHQLAAQVADLSAQTLVMGQKIAELNQKLAKLAPLPGASVAPAPALPPSAP